MTLIIRTCEHEKDVENNGLTVTLTSTTVSSRKVLEKILKSILKEVGKEAGSQITDRRKYRGEEENQTETERSQAETHFL